MATFKTTDCEIYYEDVGSGRPIVFVHGLWVTSRFFVRQKDAFSGSYRFVAPDLRGHGRSEQVLHGNKVPMQARDWHELIEHLELENVVLAGWSFGTLCIWEYLRQYGVERVAGIVVVDESPSPFMWPGWDLGYFDLPGLVHWFEAVQTNHEGLVRNRFMGRIFGTSPDPDDFEWMVQEITMIPPTIAAAIGFDNITRDYRSFLPELQVPALVCFGDHSTVPPENGPYLANALPDARLATFDCGHAPFWEKAEEFNAVVRAFVESLL